MEKKRENEKLFQLFKNYFIEYGVSLRSQLFTNLMNNFIYNINIFDIVII